MTTFNGMPYVVDQLESILEQLPDSAEIICGDDGSTDGTLDYLNSVVDNRLYILTEPNHLGVIRNYERCLQRVAGNIVFLADQDDIWLPHKVDTVVTELQQTEAMLAVHDARITDEHLTVLGADYFASMHPSRKVWRNLWRNTLIGATMAFSSELLDHALPFPRGIGMHDIWLGLVASRVGNIHLIHDRLMLYRRHTQNLSTTLTNSKRPIGTRITERVRTGLALSKRTAS